MKNKLFRLMIEDSTFDHTYVECMIDDILKERSAGVRAWILKAIIEDGRHEIHEYHTHCKQIIEAAKEQHAKMQEIDEREGYSDEYFEYSRDFHIAPKRLQDFIEYGNMNATADAWREYWGQFSQKEIRAMQF